MHEYAILENAIKEIVKKLKDQGVSSASEVRSVHLRAGALDMHGEASFRKLYNMLAKGTLLESAALHLEVDQPTLKCLKCRFSGSIPAGQLDGHHHVPFSNCPACGEPAQIIGGQGITITKFVLHKEEIPTV